MKVPRVFLAVMFTAMLVVGLGLAVYGPLDQKLVTGMLVSAGYSLFGRMGLLAVATKAESYMGTRGLAYGGEPLVICTDMTHSGPGAGGDFLPQGPVTKSCDVIRVPCYANNCGYDETNPDALADVSFGAYINKLNSGGTWASSIAQAVSLPMSCTDSSGQPVSAVSVDNGGYQTLSCTFDNNIQGGKAYAIQWQASYTDQYGTVHTGVDQQPVCSQSMLNGVPGGCLEYYAPTGSGETLPHGSYDVAVQQAAAGVTQTTETTTTSLTGSTTTGTVTYTTVINNQTSVVTTTALIVQQLVPNGWVLSDWIGAAKGQVANIGLGIAGFSAVGLVGTALSPKQLGKLRKVL